MFRFVDSTVVSLQHDFPKLELRATTDGRNPNFEEGLTSPMVTLRQSGTLRAALFHPDGTQRSPVFEKKVTRLTPLKGLPLPKSTRKGLSYAYFEQRLSTLEELSAQVPLRTGTLQTGNFLDIVHRPDSFALIFSGFLHIPATGAYTLRLRSDDGARLYLHDQLVVDNDGSHSARTREELIALEAGWHPIRIAYFDDYSGELLHCTLSDQNGHSKTLFPADFFHNQP